MEQWVAAEQGVVSESNENITTNNEPVCACH